MKQDVLILKGVEKNHVIEKFLQEFYPSGKIVVGNGSIHVYILERYYLRIQCEVGAIVLFEQNDQNHLIVHIVIAGGKKYIRGLLGAQYALYKKIRKFFVELSE